LHREVVLARYPSLQALRRIDEYREGWLDVVPALDSVDAAIGGLARIASLRELCLHDTTDARPGDAGIEPFFDRATPATLSRLELTNTRLTDAIAHTIALSPKAPSLRVLELHNSSLTLDGIHTLLAAAVGLERVGIDQSHWTEADLADYERILLDLPKSHALREVGFHWNKSNASQALAARYAIVSAS